MWVSGIYIGWTEIAVVTLAAIVVFWFLKR